MGTTLIGLIVIAVVVVYIVFIYNRLVSLRNQFKNGFAQIDVQLQRRHDLIPNLVESAKAYLAHERNTLTEVMEARNNAVSAQKDAAGDPADGAKSSAWEAPRTCSPKRSPTFTPWRKTTQSLKPTKPSSS